MAKTPVSVIILTYNEEANIRNCLESVKELTEEFFIVDSYSTDATLEIVRQYTERIFQHPWTNYARQRQWALANLPLSHDWIFFVDADERLTSDLVREISALLTREIAQPGCGGYYVRRKFIFLGKCLRWGVCQGGLKELRLSNRHYMEIAERAGHEIYICRKPVGELRECMIHEDLKPLSAWVARHNSYSTANAEHLWSLNKGDSKPTRVLLHKSELLRSLYWKELFRHKIWLRLPVGLRPFLLFFYYFFFRLGFLDGLRGAIYHIFHDFWYPLLIDAKYLDIKASQVHAGSVYAAELHIAKPEKVPVSVITLTHNEEANIAACLRSARNFCDEIFVVDFGSKDATLSIARAYTDKIYQQSWISHPEQRQWALNNLPFTHDWVLFLDAGEQLTAALIGEMSQVIRRELRSPRFGAYYLPQRYFFLGKEIRWGESLGGRKELRLCQPLNVAGRTEHPASGSNREEGDMLTPMIHEDKQPLSAWIQRHNIYSNNDARFLMEQSWHQANSSITKEIARCDQRLYWKEIVRIKLWNKLPIGLRPIIQFFLNYFIKLGLLDGGVGFIYHFLHTFWYPLLVDGKLLELKYRAELNPRK